MRKLASIQIITNLVPIENADRIELATVLGWQVIVKKGIHSIGELVVYFEIDSILPNIPQFDFLDGKLRLRTKKLKGVLSQGLVLPISEFPNLPNDIVEEVDVTELLGVIKYDSELNNPRLQGSCAGNFPDFIVKTDEVRIQSTPTLLHKFRGKKVIITTKLDGTSFTTFLRRDSSEKGYTTGICSRNKEVKDDGDNIYSQVYRKLDLEKKLFDTGFDIVIQGEICGPGIQKNRLNLDEHTLFIFNIIDLNGYRYIPRFEWKNITSLNSIPRVPIEYIIDDFDLTLKQLLELAEKTNNCFKEGIVVRTYFDDEIPRLSFKVINNNYLLKVKE